MIEKKPLIILTGPTAVGKTALSVKLAQKIDGEIISADSMQVYKYMDIGSAKISPAEMENVPHHLIDVLDPSEDCNVVRFQKMAKECMDGIYQRGNIPIVVGGTGFYIQALLYDIDFEDETEHSELREELVTFAAQNGAHMLHERLREVDEVSAKEIHENNIKRVIRALEFYETNGYPISKHNKEQRNRSSAYNSCYFVLNDERSRLYERIELRVDNMLNNGLLNEVEALKQSGYHKGLVSMQGLGYKEMLAFLDKECTYDEAVYFIKRDTRHFAKRQLTWFRREKDVIWINKPEFAYNDNQILDYILLQLKEKGIILNEFST